MTSVAKNTYFENQELAEQITIAGAQEVVFENLVNKHLQINIESNCWLVFFTHSVSRKTSIEIKLTKPGVSVYLREIAFCNQNHTFEKSIAIAHQEKKTFSDCDFIGFGMDLASITISAKTHIAKDMQGSEAHQHLQLFVEKNAQAKAEPGLFIDCHKVKASHGNAIGQISPETLYYLASKGINSQQGKAMIISSFVNKMTESLSEKSKNNIIKKMSALGAYNG